MQSSPSSPPIELTTSPSEIQPATLPIEVEALEATELGYAEADDLEAELDPDEIVEAAEALLRVGAPHDYDVVIIGSGPGGLACATRVAEGGLSVAIIEESDLGGVCLNRGCLPTKTWLHSVAALRTIKRASSFGISLEGTPRIDLGALQMHTQGRIEEMRRATLVRLELAGVTVLKGKAHFIEPHSIEITGTDARRLTAVHVVIATGGTPIRPGVPGIDLPRVLTSTEMLRLQRVPRHLVVVGAGLVGIEFAQIFAEFGAQVTLLETGTALLPGEDDELQQAIQTSLEASGVEVIFDAALESITTGDGALMVNWNQNAIQHNRSAEIVLLATGRRANIGGLNLDEVNIEVTDNLIQVDEDLGTSEGGVWAIGDCIRRHGWAHQAVLDGERVSARILGEAEAYEARFVPTCYYTFPEAASVGLTEDAAQELGIESSVGRCPFLGNERAASTGGEIGFVKLIVERETGKLLGAQIVGTHATELINEVAVLLRQGATAQTLIGTPHAHPTFAEALQTAARNALVGLS